MIQSSATADFLSFEFKRSNREKFVERLAKAESSSVDIWMPALLRTILNETNHSQQKEYLDLALAYPHKLGRAEQSDVLAYTVNVAGDTDEVCLCLRTLHEAGFRLNPELRPEGVRQAYNDVGAEMAKGRWKEVELITPRILDHSTGRIEFLSNLERFMFSGFSSTGFLQTEHVSKFVQLKTDMPLVTSLTRAFLNICEQGETMTPADRYREENNKAFLMLHEHGLIEAGRIIAAARDTPYGEVVSDCLKEAFAEIQRRDLDRGTLAAPSTPRKGARL